MGVQKPPKAPQKMIKVTALPNKPKTNRRRLVMRELLGMMVM
jgi:hypothetical protein